MLDRLKLWLMLGVLGAGLFAIFLERTPAQNKTSGTVTPADYLKWRNELKNWGRWGADDQRGASNLITADKSLNAAKLVKNGIVISLAVTRSLSSLLFGLSPTDPLTFAGTALLLVIVAILASGTKSPK